ncbi:MAG: hypothetical protein GWN93_20555 [Deltaproteobacteria bacterium]|nr:hypothetical protein [Deltaproteobacteria bacterium]
MNLLFRITVKLSCSFCSRPSEMAKRVITGSG